MASASAPRLARGVAIAARARISAVSSLPRALGCAPSNESALFATMSFWTEHNSLPAFLEESVGASAGENCVRPDSPVESVSSGNADDIESWWGPTSASEDAPCGDAHVPCGSAEPPPQSPPPDLLAWASVEDASPLAGLLDENEPDCLRATLSLLDVATLRHVKAVCAAWREVTRPVLRDPAWQSSSFSLLVLVESGASDEGLLLRMARCPHEIHEADASGKRPYDHALTRACRSGSGAGSSVLSTLFCETYFPRSDVTTTALRMSCDDAGPAFSRWLSRLDARVAVPAAPAASAANDASGAAESRPACDRALGPAHANAWRCPVVL